jgi:hypothetical protein
LEKVEALLLVYRVLPISLYRLLNKGFREIAYCFKVERETRFELATSTLARLRSTN